MTYDYREALQEAISEYYIAENIFNFTGAESAIYRMKAAESQIAEIRLAAWTEKIQITPAPKQHGVIGKKLYLLITKIIPDPKRWVK
jgi:hypothetical protein